MIRVRQEAQVAVMQRLSVDGGVLAASCTISLKSVTSTRSVTAHDTVEAEERPNNTGMHGTWQRERMRGDEQGKQAEGRQSETATSKH